MGEAWTLAWRVPAAGLAYTVFGLGGLLVALASPLLWLLPRALRQQVARAVVHHYFRFFIGLLRLFRLVTVEVHGRERLRQRGLLVLANHPSLIDVVFLLSFLPQSGCVVRAGLARNPFTRAPVRAAGYVTNDAGPALVDDCRAVLEAGDSLVIFPEGTRTPRSGEVRLQRGAANVAVRCRHAVTPVTITVEPRVLCKGEPWYRLPPRAAHFVITVHPDLPVPPVAEDGSEPLAVRRLNERLEAFFQEESQRAGARAGNRPVHR